MAEVLLGFLLHTYRERPGLIPPPPSPATPGWAFYKCSHSYLMALPSFQITLSTLAGVWFMGAQQKGMDYRANEWIKWTQEGRSRDQLHVTHFLKWHFYYLGLCAWFHRGFKEPGSRQILNYLKKPPKTMEFSNMDLPPLISFIQIRCRNFCDSL